MSRREETPQPSPAREYAARWVNEVCDDNFRFGILRVDTADPIAHEGAVRGRKLRVSKKERSAPLRSRDLRTEIDSDRRLAIELASPTATREGLLELANRDTSRCYFISDTRQQLIDDLVLLFLRGANAWDNGGKHAYNTMTGVFFVHLWHDHSHDMFPG